MALAGKEPLHHSKALSFDSEHLLRSENIAFDIDNWYPALKKWTFETHFLPLSRAEARAIIHYYRSRFLGHAGLLSRSDADVLSGLESRLDFAVQDFRDQGCFPRLCGRSAKDGFPLNRDRVRREYADAIRKVTSLHGSDLPASLRMLASTKVEVLRCRSGAEVMNLLLTSERVYADMIDWLNYGEPEQVVLRRWEPEVSVDLEFRLYVYENSLNAISQYDHHCRYEHLSELKTRLEPRLVALWKELHPSVGVASYCVDIAYLPRVDELVMVELSPFLRCTGAHCFRWSNPDDVDILEERRPFEFRLVQEVSPHFQEMFHQGWEEGWNDAAVDSAPYWKCYQPSSQRYFFRATQEAFLQLQKLMRLSGSAGLAVIGLVAAEVLLATCRPRTVMPIAVGLFCAAGAAAAGRRFRQRSWFPLFVYGTLKRNAFWHRKFLSHGTAFCAEAVTADAFPLVVGRCGVPYLLHDQKGTGHRIRGELFLVDAETLAGLDQYEGVDKKYYGRVQLEISVNGRQQLADVYAMTHSTPPFRRLAHLCEYSLPWHLDHYRPVQHILLKQQLYLQGHLQYGYAGPRHPARCIDDDAPVELQERM